MNNMLGDLINSSDLSDVTFLMDGKHHVHANKAILAARSRYFQTMLFNSCMKESIQALTEARNGVLTHECNSIEIKDVSYEVFLKMLE